MEARKNLAPGEKVWLVKSATRILGPYSLTEISEFIMRRHVSILDEMKGPTQRWTYVRENPFLKEIIEAIRREQDSAKEDTVTTATQTSVTMTKTDLVLGDDFTRTPVHISDSSSRSLDVSVPQMRDAVRVGETNVSQVQPKAPSTKSYGASSARKRPSALKTILQSMVLGAVGLLVVALALRYLGNYKQEVARDKIYQDSMLKAIKYRNIGLYDFALRDYNRASQIHAPDQEAQFQMAALLISSPSTSLQGRAIYEGALQTMRGSRDALVEAHTGIGLSYWGIDDGKVEGHWLEGLNQDVKNTNLLTDLAAFYLRKKRFSDFDGTLAKIKTPQPLPTFLKGLGLIERKDFSEESQRSFEAAKDRTLAETPQLVSELELLNVYLKFRSKKLSDEDILGFVDQFPGLSRNFVRDPFLLWQIVNQDYLSELCQEVHDSLSKNSDKEVLATLLLSRCLMDAGRDFELSDKLKIVTTKEPSNPIVLRMNIYSLFLMDRFDEARTMAQDKPEIQNDNILLVRSLSCLKGNDLKCIQDLRTAALEMDAKNPYTPFLLASIHLKTGAKEEGYRVLKEGLLRFPGFEPMIELRDQLESQ